MGYTIFAIADTLVCAIIFAAMVASDTIKAKKKEKGDAEVFDTSSMVDDKPVIVREVSEDGKYEMDYPDKETPLEKKDSQPVIPQNPITTPPTPSADKVQQAQNSGEPTSTPTPSLYEQMKAIQEKNCPVIIPRFQEEYDSEKYASIWRTDPEMQTKVKAVRMIV